tara:strand:+ start:464 stop:2152 length:1689 start_codon:yes stop_codon:yes gene_type:complete
MKKNFIIIKTVNNSLSKKYEKIYSFKKKKSIDNLLIFYDDIYDIAKENLKEKTRISINLNAESTYNKIFDFLYHNETIDIRIDAHKTKIFFLKIENSIIISNDLYSLKEYGTYLFSYDKYFKNILLNINAFDIEQTIFQNILSFSSNTRYFINEENKIIRKRYNLEINTKTDLKSFESSLEFFSKQFEILVDKYSNLSNLGLLLSSGQDSSLLAYYLSKKSKKITNFTIGFNDKYHAWDESSIAKDFSNYLNIKHEKIIFNTSDYEEGLKNAILFAGYIPINESEITFFKSSKAIKSFGINHILNGDIIDLPLGHNFGANELIIKNLNKKVNFNFFKELYELLLYRYPFNRGYFKFIKFYKQLFKFNIDKLFIDKALEIRYVKYLLNKFNKKYLQINEINEIINSINHNDIRQKINTIDTYLKVSITNKYDNFFQNHQIININAFSDKDFLNNILSIPSVYNYKDFNDSKYHSNEKFLMRTLVKNNLPDYIFKRRKYGFGIPTSIMIKQTSLYDYLLSKKFIEKEIMTRSQINFLINNDKNDLISNLLFKLVSYELMEEIFT